MDIRPICTDADYNEALAEIERLWDARPGTPEEAKVELLAMLVHNYERALEPLPPLDPVEAIKFHMEQQGLTRKDFLRVFSTTARVSEVLSRKRALTLDMIRKLHALFDIPLESLIASGTKTPRARTKARPKRRDASSTRRRRGKARPSASP